MKLDCDATKLFAFVCSTTGGRLKFKVLIVEDESIIAEDIKETFVDWGFDVVGVTKRQSRASRSKGRAS